MLNYIFIIRKIIKLKDALTQLLQYMEAIKSLPGQLSSIVNNAEQAMSSITSALSQAEQKGANILSNMGNLPSSTQKTVCDACGASQDTVNKILNNDPTVTQEEVKDTINKLSIISSVSESVSTAEAVGQDNLDALIPEFSAKVNPNISKANFSGVTDKFFRLADTMNTDIGSLSNKLADNYSNVDKIPEPVKSTYGLPPTITPTDEDIKNRNMTSYSNLVNNMSTESFKKATGFIYDFNNLKSRIKAMTNFTDGVKNIVESFVGGAVAGSSFAAPTPEPPAPSGDVYWGDILGNISAQEDLQAALDAKTDIDGVIDGGDET